MNSTEYSLSSESEDDEPKQQPQHQMEFFDVKEVKISDNALGEIEKLQKIITTLNGEKDEIERLHAVQIEALKNLLERKSSHLNYLLNELMEYTRHFTGIVAAITHSPSAPPNTCVCLRNEKQKNP